ncbi:MAG TPA: flagellar FliJ family protein [Stellaceae bacterium]|nr:flagellar FliJ family protein [Stellaceae bacterium]
MTETLDTLIRLHRWQVDERRRQVAELEGFAEKLRHELVKLAEERAAESQAAGTNLLTRHVYPGYIRRALQRQKTLEQSLAETEQQIVAARDALAEAFQELKRYEVAEAARERLRMSAATRRERIETDAIAIENFRRRAGGG